MNTYALGTFSASGSPRFAAMVIDGRAAPLATLAQAASVGDAAAWSSMLAVLEDWEARLPLLDALAAEPPAGVAWHRLETLLTHPPVDLPRQVFCTGANYRKHVVDLTVDSGVGPEGLDREGLRRWAENMMDERVAHGQP